MAPIEQAAITTTGVVVDLDGGCRIFFEYSKESSPSHRDKQEKKELHRMIHAAQIAHAQDEVDFGYRFTSLGESVKMWIRTWPGIGLDDSEVHLAIACKQLRRMAWFEYKTGVFHPSDGMYQIDDRGVAHKAFAEIDGPALTLDGTVVDLDGGYKTFFSHSKEMSPSHAAKERAKEEFRMMRATELAHYNDEVLMGYRDPVPSVLCTDEAGIVQSNTIAVEKKDRDSDRNAVEKKKVIHRKKRSIGSPQISVDIDDIILVLDDNGMVQSTSPKNAYTPKKQMPFPSLGMKGDGILCVDATGIVHAGKGFKVPLEIAEPFDLPRLLSEPDAELSPQNPGASPEPCVLPEVCI